MFLHMWWCQNLRSIVDFTGRYVNIAKKVWLLRKLWVLYISSDVEAIRWMKGALRMILYFEHTRGVDVGVCFFAC